MPTFIDYLDEKQKKHPGADATPLPGAGGSLPSTLTNTPYSHVGGNAPSAGEGSGKFVNFQRYLQGNQAAAGQTAKSLADKTESAGRTAEQNMQAYHQQHTQAVNAGTNTYRPAPSGPTKGGPTRQERLQQGAQQGYTGPQSYTGGQGYQDVQRSVNDAYGQSQQIADYHGRQQMMADQAAEAGQNYTKGMGSFDSALTGAVGNQRFAGVKERFGGLVGEFDRLAAEGQAQVQDAQTISQASQSQYQSDLDRYLAWEEEQARLAAEQEAAQKKAAADAQVEKDRATAVAATNNNPEGSRSQTDTDRAARDGYYEAWLAAGAPPYDQWKQQHLASKGTR